MVRSVVGFLVVVLSAAPLIKPPAIRAQGAQPALVWPEIALEPLPNTAVSSPVHLTHAGDGSGRLFIVEQAGRIRIYQNGSLRTTPFLDIREDVLGPGDAAAGPEEGLLSVAFPPNYAARGYFYVYYTNTNSNNQVSRFHLSSANQADPNSEEKILEISHPVFHNHNGGQMAYGPDGFLYIGTGDGGSGGDPDNNAQNRSSLLGKILRIDPDDDLVPDIANPHRTYLPLQLAHGPALGPYRIPKSNPFFGVSGARPEIWAYGLRNPWRFSFDRQNGALYIADVGQQKYEEINFQPPIAQGGGGENYGWRIMEGKHCYGSASCNQAGLTRPVWEYEHIEGACSVTGGFVYRGANYPGLRGIYLYADWCNGRMWGLARDGSAWVGHTFDHVQSHISSFGQDQDGELYAVVKDGAIYRVVVP
jgi:glucose/arabinose dehydrogenase